MRVLVFHGYLLRGTGSNVYNANLARALARLGHEVHLLCQDRAAGELGWVDAVGRWREGRLRVEPAAKGRSPGQGSITAYLPEIDGLLPVYVADEYEGFRVKTFGELTEAELDRYLAANVDAVREVAALAGGIDAALANHLIMGPAILARSGLPFAAKVHGSALSYTVIPNPRFLPHAREGTAAAAGVLVGSRHTAESLWETVGDPGLPARTRLGPPGVDVRRFRPPAGEERLEDLLSALAARLAGAGEEPALGRDGAEAARALRGYATAPGPRVAFVGKLIVSKGCDLLLAAWPLVRRAAPEASLLLVGFGNYRAALERLWAALTAGDLGQAREIAAAGWALEGGPRAPLPMLASFLEEAPAGYPQAAAAAAGSVHFSGRLEHDEVAEVLRASEAMVVPSTFPEAFGMVAAEAAATGALPVCAGHSGLAEVAAELDRVLPAELSGLTAFPLGPGAVAELADRLCAWLTVPEPRRRELGRRLAATVERLWSWEGVAAGVIAAAHGDLEGLPAVPGERPGGAGRSAPRTE